MQASQMEFAVPKLFRVKGLGLRAHRIMLALFHFLEARFQSYKGSKSLLG